jgi:hypothetical protein
MKAKNLRQALNILDPERPLRTEDELQNFFVTRALSPLDDLRLLLQETSGPQKVLFTGHRGSGKSTELAKLTQALYEQFFIIHYSIKSILNLFDLKYIDVVLSLGLELIRETTAKKVKIKKKVLNHVLNFTKEITKETETGIEGQAEIGAELNLYVVKLSSKLGTEDATRTTVRETVSHRLSDLLESIDLLAREVEKNTKQRILVIIEDLDKTDLNTAKELFYEHATSLLAPPVSIIYTFPTALRHDNDFMQVEMSFPNVYILPNLKTRSRNGEKDEAGLARLREILTKRVEVSLFMPEVLTTLAELSSGIPRELIALGRRACLEAMKSNQPRIDANHVEKAARSKRMDYQVLLTTEQLVLLKQVEQTKRVENNEAHRALLHNLSALEYRNDVGIWHDVHPLIKPLLNEGNA